MKHTYIVHFSGISKVTIDHEPEDEISSQTEDLVVTAFGKLSADELLEDSDIEQIQWEGAYLRRHGNRMSPVI